MAYSVYCPLDKKDAPYHQFIACELKFVCNLRITFEFSGRVYWLFWVCLLGHCHPERSVAKSKGLGCELLTGSFGYALRASLRMTVSQ